MLAAITNVPHELKPSLVITDPGLEGSLVTNGQLLPRRMVRLEPVAPHPFMHVVGRNRAVDRQARGLRTVLKVRKILKQLFIKVAGRLEIEHRSAPRIELPIYWLPWQLRNSRNQRRGLPPWRRTACR